MWYESTETHVNTLSSRDSTFASCRPGRLRIRTMLACIYFPDDLELLAPGEFMRSGSPHLLFNQENKKAKQTRSCWTSEISYLCDCARIHPSIQPSLHPSSPPSLHPSTPSVPPSLHPSVHFKIYLHTYIQLYTRKGLGLGEHCLTLSRLQLRVR